MYRTPNTYRYTLQVHIYLKFLTYIGLQTEKGSDTTLKTDFLITKFLLSGARPRNLFWLCWFSVRNNIEISIYLKNIPNQFSIDDCYMTNLVKVSSEVSYLLRTSNVN